MEPAEKLSVTVTPAMARIKKSRGQFLRIGERGHPRRTSRLPARGRRTLRADGIDQGARKGVD
jgi:hypothetical protein